MVSRFLFYENNLLFTWRPFFFFFLFVCQNSSQSACPAVPDPPLYSDLSVLLAGFSLIRPHLLLISFTFTRRYKYNFKKKACAGCPGRLSAALQSRNSFASCCAASPCVYSASWQPERNELEKPLPVWPEESRQGVADRQAASISLRFLIGFSRRTWARITSCVNAPFFMVTLCFTALSPRLRERLAPFLKNSYWLVGFPFSPTVNYQGTGCYPDVRVYSRGGFLQRATWQTAGHGSFVDGGGCYRATLTCRQSLVGGVGAAGWKLR